MIKETRKIEAFGGMKLPKLKGHVKLTLHNVHNGKNEVIEGDNVITDALSNIMMANLLGCVDYTKIFGSEGFWQKWLGGILCYEKAHENLDADDYGIVNSVTNPLTAHAGYTSIDPDHDDDLSRGNPSGSSIEKTSDGIKMVWTWEPTHGNGWIRGLSLTHSDTGSYGLGSYTYGFKNSFSPFEQIQGSNLVAVSQMPRTAGNAFAQYDDNHTLFFYIGADEWYEPSASVPSGETMINEVTVYVRRLPYTKAGVFDIATGSDAVYATRKFTVTTSVGFKYNPAYYFDPETKYLWLFTNFTYAVARDQDVEAPHTSAREWSRNIVRYTVIDCNPDIPDENREVDYGTIVSDDDDLAYLDYSSDGSLGSRMYYGARVFQQNILKDGDDVYFPMGSSVAVAGQGHSAKQNVIGFKKINIDTNDQEAILFNDSPQTVLDKYYGLIKAGDLIIGGGFVGNGGSLYPCLSTPFTYVPSGWDAYDNFYFNELTSPVIYATRRPANENDNQFSYRARYIFANKMVNISKFNCEAKEKTASTAMTVEYTITEVEPEEP